MMCSFRFRSMWIAIPSSLPTLFYCYRMSMELQPELKLDPKWRPVEDVELKDLSIDDDDIEPFVIKCDRFEYKNKAQIKLDEEIEAAMAEYDKRHRNLSPFDAIAPPAIASLAGGIRPIDITKNAHFSLTSPNLLSTTRIIRIRIRYYLITFN